MIQLVLLGVLVPQKGCTAAPFALVETSTNSRARPKRTGQKNSYYPSPRHLSPSTPSGGTWNQVGIDIDGESPDDGSGYALAMSANGTRIIVGAPGNEGNGEGSGHARVYEEVDCTWLQIGSDVDGESEYNGLGNAVAMSADGTRIVIGAPYDRSGYVRVYEEVDGTWSQIGGDVNGESPGDESGSAVAMSANGSRIVVGAIRNSGTYDPFYTGHARVYEEVDGTWLQICWE